MKKLLLLSILVVISFLSFGQFPVQQPIGAKHTLNRAQGAYGSDSGYVLINSFADTAAMNRGPYLKGVPGIILRAGDTLWMRNSTATAWIKQTSSGLSPNAWNIDGNYGTNGAVNFLGTIDNQPLRFRIGNNRYGGFFPQSITVLDSLTGSKIAIGYGALDKDTSTGNTNIAIGGYALHNYPTINPTSAASGNIAIGHMALYSAIGGGSENNVAIGFRSMARLTTGWRNVAVGLNSGHSLTTGQKNTFIGTFAGEWTTTGVNNDAVGEGALRNNTIGVGNSAHGNNSLFYTSGSINSISVVAGGSGYTGATVTISPPDTQPFGFSGAVQATATATVNAGAVTGITITNRGVGYSGPVTVTITGDGTGANATATLASPDVNTALGVSALFANISGYGNTAAGYQAGNTTIIDSFNTFLGYRSGRNLASPSTVPMSKSTAIGYLAKVSQANSIVLGATGADQPNIGIGTEAPDRMFDVNGRGIFRDTLNGKVGLFYNNSAANQPGIVVNNTFNPVTTSIPIYGHSLIDGSPLKIVDNSTADHGITIFRGRASNFGGAGINYVRTNSDDPTVKSAVLAAQSLGQEIYWGVSGNNSTMSAGAMVRARAYGTPKTTYVPSYWEVQLVDTVSSTLSTKLSVRPYEVVVGENAEGVSASVPTSILTINSITRGFMLPRLSSANQAAMLGGTPTNGLMIVNSDSLGRVMVYYNGTWHGVAFTDEIGSGGGGGGGTAWGAITGTLSAQTDLQSALDGKVNNTGNETIAGVKTFSSNPILSAMSSGRVVYTTTGGELIADGNFLWDGATMRINGQIGINKTHTGVANNPLQVLGFVDYANATAVSGVYPYQQYGGWDFSGSVSPAGTVLLIGGVRASQWTQVNLRLDGVDRLNISSTETNINNTGIARNFRVATDNNANTFFVDGTNDRIGVKTSTPDSTLTINGGLRINNGAAQVGYVWTATNTSGGGTWASLPTFASSSYTPTTYNTTNISSSTVNITRYYRVGDDVTVYGTLTATPTAELNDCVLGVDFPIPSDIANDFEVGGSGTLEMTGAPNVSVSIKGDVTNNRALFSFYAPDDGFARTITFQLSYKITPP